MQQYAWERRVDVVIISEPNRHLPFWHNDTKGHASIWAIRFNGLNPSEDTLAEEEGYVRVKIGEVYCVSGFFFFFINVEEIRTDTRTPAW